MTGASPERYPSVTGAFPERYPSVTASRLAVWRSHTLIAHESRVVTLNETYLLCGRLSETDLLYRGARLIILGRQTYHACETDLLCRGGILVPCKRQTFPFTDAPSAYRVGGVHEVD